MNNTCCFGMIYEQTRIGNKESHVEVKLSRGDLNLQSLIHPEFLISDSQTSIMTHEPSDLTPSPNNFGRVAPVRSGSLSVSLSLCLSSSLCALCTATVCRLCTKPTNQISMMRYIYVICYVRSSTNCRGITIGLRIWTTRRSLQIFVVLNLVESAVSPSHHGYIHGSWFMVGPFWANHARTLVSQSDPILFIYRPMGIRNRDCVYNKLIKLKFYFSFFFMRLILFFF
jgi:hypothetical protein